MSLEKRSGFIRLFRQDGRPANATDGIRSRNAAVLPPDPVAIVIDTDKLDDNPVRIGQP
ncbi:hypothetical protein D3C87_1740500 [compost metagenome]